MRIFVAAIPPKQIKGELAKIKNDFGEFSAKWVEEKNLHITLAFIGEVEDCSPAQYREIMRDTEDVAAKLSPVKLKTGGVSLFPDEYKARLLVVNLTGETEKLEALAESVKRCLRKTGTDLDNKPFRPHITLAHLKRVHPRKRRNIRQKVDDYKISKEPFDINQIILMESRLTTNGPIYRPLRTIPHARTKGKGVNTTQAQSCRRSNW